MEIEKTFHMKEGVDGTSYSKNSFVQKKASDAMKFLTPETVEQVYITTAPKSFGIADLGCSSGHNALSNISEIVAAIEGISLKVSQPAPEFRVYLNDLPTNDFNTIFKALPGFYLDLKNESSHGDPPTLYIGGYPGTFYGRLFPDNSLHFIYSNASVHWLSKIPPGLYDEKCRSINKGSVYITKYSPPEVHEAYSRQFQEDFTLFLHSRSKELVSGGGMVLILSGRQGPNHIDRGISFLFEIFTRALSSLVNKGDIEQDKLDSYDIHYYAPSGEELEDLIRKEGSLKLDRLVLFETEKDVPEGKSYGIGVAMTVRAVQESMLSHHFGDAILDDLFEIYGKMVDEELAKEDIRPIYYVVVLRKI